MAYSPQVPLFKFSNFKVDKLVKSLFPLPWWEGIKGRGKLDA
jgi:hypothetical protein